MYIICALNWQMIRYEQETVSFIVVQPSVLGIIPSAGMIFEWFQDIHEYVLLEVYSFEINASTIRTQDNGRVANSVGYHESYSFRLIPIITSKWRHITHLSYYSVIVHLRTVILISLKSFSHRFETEFGLIFVVKK